jgi:hypothetical protein
LVRDKPVTGTQCINRPGVVTFGVGLSSGARSKPCTTVRLAIGQVGQVSVGQPTPPSSDLAKQRSPPSGDRSSSSRGVTTSNCDLNYIAGWAALRQRTKPVVPDRASEEPSKDGHNRACVALDRARGQLMGYVAIISKSQVPMQRGIDGKRNHPLGSNLKTRTHVLLGRAIIARFRDRRLPMSSEQCCCENYMQQKHCCGDVRALKSLRTRERRPRGSVAYN